jgi:hypothetical protein
MKMNAKQGMWLILSALLAVCVLVAANSWAERRSASQQIVSGLKAHLHTAGDWVKVSDVHPGAWARVCLLESMSTGGTLDAATIKSIVGLTGPLDLPNGIASSSDWNWVLMFL